MTDTPIPLEIRFKTKHQLKVKIIPIVNVRGIIVENNEYIDDDKIWEAIELSEYVIEIMDRDEQ